VRHVLLISHYFIFNSRHHLDKPRRWISFGRGFYIYIHIYTRYFCMLSAVAAAFYLSFNRIMEDSTLAK
jgi:hypothetical protein